MMARKDQLRSSSNTDLELVQVAGLIAGSSWIDLTRFGCVRTSTELEIRYVVLKKNLCDRIEYGSNRKT